MSRSTAVSVHLSQHVAFPDPSVGRAAALRDRTEVPLLSLFRAPLTVRDREHVDAARSAAERHGCATRLVPQRA